MSKRAISWLFVTKCEQCPCDYDNYCSHPDAPRAPHALLTTETEHPPAECPLRKQALCIALPRDV